MKEGQTKNAAAYNIAYKSTYETTYKTIYDATYARARSELLCKSVLSSAERMAIKFRDENQELAISDPDKFERDMKQASDNTASWYSIDELDIIEKANQIASEKAADVAAELAASAARVASEHYDAFTWEEEDDDESED